MREILFRGKRLDNGEWVDGCLFVDDKGEKHEILIGYVNYRISWEVDPNTIGQYTGLCDKNGKKIFEGDILGYWASHCEIVSEEHERVVFGVHNCSCCHAVYGWSTEKDGLYGRFIDTPEECVVIGNIHDNPELLKGE